MKLKLALLLSSIFIFLGCDPLVTTFPNEQTATRYSAKTLSDVSTIPDTLLVMTWNIRFGAGQIRWFGDGCGDRVILTEDEVIQNLEGIASAINRLQPDIVLVQEIDRESKRSAYLNQIQWLLDNTSLNYGVYAPIWQTQYVPSDGLGRVDAGNAVLSKWEINNSTRIPLALRGDQDALTRYFYLRRNILKASVAITGQPELTVLNVHTAAFSTDNTKKKHLEAFMEEINDVAATGELFVAGGDLNTLPPGSDSTNYCDESRCVDDPAGSCPDGADYTPESDWLVPFYNEYDFAIPLNDYQADNLLYYTQAQYTEPNKKLDYLLTRKEGWVPGSFVTHQDLIQYSDHVPVTARLVLNP